MRSYHNVPTDPLAPSVFGIHRSSRRCCDNDCPAWFLSCDCRNSSKFTFSCGKELSSGAKPRSFALCIVFPAGTWSLCCWTAGSGCWMGATDRGRSSPSMGSSSSESWMTRSQPICTQLSRLEARLFEMEIKSALSNASVTRPHVMISIYKKKRVDVTLNVSRFKLLMDVAGII